MLAAASSCSGSYSGIDILIYSYDDDGGDDHDDVKEGGDDEGDGRNDDSGNDF